MMADDEIGQGSENPGIDPEQQKLVAQLKEKISSSETKPQNGGQVAPDIPSLHLGSSVAETSPAPLESLADGDSDNEDSASAAESSGSENDALEDETSLSGRERIAEEPTDGNDGQEVLETETSASVDALSRNDFVPSAENNTSAPAAADGPGYADGGEISAGEPASLGTVASDEPSGEDTDQSADDESGNETPANTDFSTVYEPEAYDDIVSTAENSPLNIDVLANDVSWNGEAKTLTSVNLVSGSGSASIVGGEVSFDPGSDYDYLAVGETAEVLIDYVVEDGGGLTDTGRLTLTVTGSNDGPVVSNALADQS
ncbi:MAG: Ig-like domain-containing protein, partial [Pseudomonadota bacterium]